MPTIEELSAQMTKTADTVEKALEDIKSKKASKQEVIDLITEQKKKDDELLTKTQSDVKDLNIGITEVSKTIESVQSQIKNLRTFKTSSLFDGGRYNGHFSCPAEAKTFALLVMAATMANEPALKSRYDHIQKQLDTIGINPYWLDPEGKAMVGSSQTGGSALVTIEQIPSIIMLLEQYGVYRASCQPMPMGAGSTLMPKIDGLLTMYVPGEGGAVTSTAPTIATVGLVPKTLTGITAYSIELQDDSLVALGEMLAGLFARSCAYYEDLCGFLGDGTSTYFGFKGITGALRAVDATIANIKSLIVGSGNTYGALTLPNFNSVVGNLPEFADNGEACWYEHRYFYYTVFVALALAAGGTHAAEVIQGAGQREKLQLGYPLKFTQVMPRATASSQICSIFGNLRQGAYLGTRGGIEIAQSTERYFDQGLVAILCRDRICINVHGVGDTTKAGPITGLIMAA